MEAQVTYIIEKLELEIKKERKTNKFNRQHIFLDIKNYIKKDLEPSDTIKLNYHFYIFEKCLQLTREREYGLANFWIKEAEASYKSLDTYLQRPLNLLYFPMLAYYYYALEDYEKALSLLSKERKAIDEIFQEDKALSTEFNLEQLINIYRTYYDMGDKKAAFYKGGAILKFLISEEENDIVKGDLKKLKKDNIKNVENWICYVTDSILTKIIYSKEEPRLHHFCELFTPISNHQASWKNFPIKGYKPAVASVVAYQRKDYQRQVLEGIKMVENISDIPSFLQYLALDCLVQTITLHYPSLTSRYSDAYNNYLKQILKIKPAAKMFN